MFTGLVEELGTVVSSSSGKLTVKAPKISKDCNNGDSIAVNGTCLTATKIENDSISFDVMEKTDRSSVIGKLKQNDVVNLERALTPSTRMGGHFVQGHIDGIGQITNIKKEQNSTLFKIKTSTDLLSNIVSRGSVAINGISLTVAELHSDHFTLSLIPTTLTDTTLGANKVGDNVNIEVDILGKYVKSFLNNTNSNGITKDLLERTGFIG